MARTSRRQSRVEALADKNPVPPKTGIVEAVGVAVTSAAGKERAKELERAMSDAVTAAYAAGVTDPDEMRQRMLDARVAKARELDAPPDKSPRSKRVAKKPAEKSAPAKKPTEKSAPAKKKLTLG